jgi:glycosyl transferase family 11
VQTIATFSEQFGRLGNQLFQLALLFALDARHGYGFYLPRGSESLWDCVDVPVPATGPPCERRFDEVVGSCNFDPQVFEQPDGTAFAGYFQSYRYFEDCSAELRAFLQFHPRHQATKAALLSAYRRRLGRPLVAVHIRRADYLKPTAEEYWGNLFTDGYYERAIAAIGDGVAYLVFSDDIPWCKRSLALAPAEFADIDTCTSLAVMSGCDINVVANSTFSWWGAYLNPDADVYAPAKWWRAATGPNERQDDIVPPAWRTIPTFTSPS